MIRRIVTLFWLCALVPRVGGAELTALVYHDILSDPGRDPHIVSRSMFVAQMDYLKLNGYQPVSLDLLEEVKDGKARLPDKAVLLTFDDALRSYGEFVAPLLKLYGYPSVVSVIGAWANGAHVPPEYQGRVMTWEELRRLRNSPLVEMVSHTYDLHRGIPSNPQGNENAASIARRYSKETGAYESEAEFRRRIRGDFEAQASELKRHLGFLPRAIAWPYGNYDQVLIEEMTRAGMRFHFTMDNGPTALEELPRIKRIIVRNTPTLAGFIDDFQYKYRQFDQRIVELSLEPFRGIPAAKQEELLSRLLDRLEVLRANTVILSPFTADRREAFFHNRQMPVTTDILNRTLHQILTRLRIQRIYLKLPPALPAADPGELYSDLARLNWFSGIIFDSASAPEIESRIREVVRYYRPVAKIGVEGRPAPGRQYDFAMMRLDSALSRSNFETRAQEIKSMPAETLVVLGRSPEEDGRELAARLRLLQGWGVKHFGYGPDDYVAALPTHYLVAAELSVKGTKRKGR